MAWIKISVDLPNHPKLLALADELGIDKELALAKLITWFVWVRKYAPTGNSRKFPYLTGWDEVVEKTGWTIDGWVKDWPEWGGAEIAESARRGQTEYKEMLEKYGLKVYGKKREKTGKNGKIPSRREENRREEKIQDHLPESLEAYKSYPSITPEGRATGKCHEDLKKIDKILRQGKYPLMAAIEYHKKTSMNGNVKNLSTFLNNLPDPSTFADKPTAAPHVLKVSL